MKFRIDYSTETEDHFLALTAGERTLVLDRVDSVLTVCADVPSRNRKLLRANWLAPWELRVGDLRVFYDIDYDAEHGPVVLVRAIGKKVRNNYCIGGERVDLEL